MRFSIIVPVYNVQDYLYDCLNSIFYQSYTDFEAICVNDGSTDGSRGIICQFESRYDNLRLIDQENLGLSVARNTGIANATGEYILFVDADDYLANEFALQKINNGLTEEFDLLYMGFIKKNYKDVEVIPRQETSTKLFKLFNEDNFQVWNQCYRRQFLLDNNMTFIPRRFLEDYIFSLRAVALAKRISFIEEVTYVYRQGRPGSLTSNMSFKNISDIVRNIADMIELTEQIPIEYRNRWLHKIDNRFRHYLPTVSGYMLTKMRI